MLASIVPVARASVVDAVTNRLQAEIVAGRFAAGTKLPSERELALALGINRLTLRASLARIEALGFIATRHGSGTVVTTWRERASLEALPLMLSTLRPGEESWLEFVGSLLEVRRVLVSEAIALAVARHREEDLIQMRKIATKQRKNISDPIQFARGDIAFQREVVRCTKNIGFELILNTFAKFPDEYPELISLLYDRCEDAVDFYDVVLELLKSHDPDGVRATVTHLLFEVDKDWMERHR